MPIKIDFDKGGKSEAYIRANPNPRASQTHAVYDAAGMKVLSLVVHGGHHSASIPREDLATLGEYQALQITLNRLFTGFRQDVFDEMMTYAHGGNYLLGRYFRESSNDANCHRYGPVPIDEVEAAIGPLVHFIETHTFSQIVPTSEIFELLSVSPKDDPDRFRRLVDDALASRKTRGKPATNVGLAELQRQWLSLRDAPMLSQAELADALIDQAAQAYVEDNRPVVISETPRTETASSGAEPEPGA